MTMKRITVLMTALFAMTGALYADDEGRRTSIHHSDGSTTTVTTDRAGTQAITPGHGGGQFGRGIPHDTVVKDYTRPGSRIEPRQRH
jgi:hypothetical protein